MKEEMKTKRAVENAAKQQMEIDKTCTCNDESQSQNYVCRECKQEKSRPLYRHERVAACPLHYFQIAICNFGMPAGLGPICDSCQPDQRF